jgi:hypothetical protein
MNDARCGVALSHAARDEDSEHRGITLSAWC